MVKKSRYLGLDQYFNFYGILKMDFLLAGRELAHWPYSSKGFGTRNMLYAKLLLRAFVSIKRAYLDLFVKKENCTILSSNIIFFVEKYFFYITTSETPCMFFYIIICFPSLYHTFIPNIKVVRSNKCNF